MKFDCIIMDSPWNFSDTLTMSNTKRGANTNYCTMSNEDLKKLDIKSLANPDGAILCLWVPSSLLDVGLECLEAYGFTLKQTYVWVKCKKKESLFKLFSKLFKDLSFDSFYNDLTNYLTAFGMGRLMRASHEICLIGINNKKIYKKLQNKSQRSVCFSENLGHSQKPYDLHKSLELMFPNANYLEIFARRTYPNWYTIGNECPSTLNEDIKVSIENLKEK